MNWKNDDKERMKRWCRIIKYTAYKHQKIKHNSKWYKQLIKSCKYIKLKWKCLLVDKRLFELQYINSWYRLIGWNDMFTCIKINCEMTCAWMNKNYYANLLLLIISLVDLYSYQFITVLHMVSTITA